MTSTYTNDTKKRKFQRSKPVKYVILGPVKCGTCSLQEYYRKKYPEFECLRVETIWREDGIEKWEKLKEKNPDAIPVIIMRNVVDAVWSYFNYFKYLPADMTFPEFLEKPINHRHGKLETIVEGYDYARWLKKWEKYDPVVVSLDVMKKLPEFPVKNQTLERRNRARVNHKWVERKTPILTEEYRRLVVDRLNKIVTI